MQLTYSELPGVVTQVVLIEAAQAGIKTIGICKAHKSLKNSDWREAPPSLFADERDASPWRRKERDGFPSIWRVGEESGIGAGCGNTGQFQIHTGDGLEPGVWRLKAKHWEKLA